MRPLNQSRIDLSAVIDAAPFVGLPLRVMVLSFLVMTIDGYDLQAMAFAAPALSTQWHVARALLGPVLAASIVGMAVGSIGFGALGDRIGRKRSLALCVGLLCIGSLASVFAVNLAELALCRVLTGLGLGGATPLATALIAEWTPRRWRSAAVAVVIVGVPLGGTLGAALAAWLIPLHGWQAVFLCGAALPAGLLALVLPVLPESPKYLATRPGQRPALAAALNALVREPRYSGHEAVVQETATSSHSGRRGGFLLLFSSTYWSTTLLLWSAFACNSLALYSFVNWLPTVLTSAGLPLKAALRGSMFFNVGGMVGALLGSALIYRYGSRRVGSTIALGGAVATCLVGTLAVTSALGTGENAELLLWVALSGAALNGMQNFLYVVAAHAYATPIRALGVGCASTLARAGGVLSSVLGSAVFAWGLSARDFFYAIAAVIVVTTVSYRGVPLHIAARVTE